MRGPGRLLTGASVALAGLVLAVGGCSQALPLGPAPAPVPAPSHLAAAIILQPGVSDLGSSAGNCPAGSVALSGPGAISGAPGAGSASPVSSASTPMGACFRLLGKPVTFTSAGVAVNEQPAGSQPVQHPASWQVLIYLPAAEAAELRTVTTKLAGTEDQVAIIIGGQTWAMPVTAQPLTSGEFGIYAQSKSEALHIQSLLR